MKKSLFSSNYHANLSLTCLSFEYTMLFSPSEIVLLPVALIAVITAINKLLRWRQDRAFAESHGCKPPAKLSRIPNIREVLHANRKHAWLDMWNRRYKKVAPTFESSTVSLDPIVFTNEPENIKTILATNFSAFDLGERRKKLMDPIVGSGIFSTDGQAWRHSRVCRKSKRPIEAII